MTEHAPKPLLEITDLRTLFPIQSSVLRRTTGYVRAVDGVSITVRAGETVGLVGESGSGKSTLARTLIGLETATGGSVKYNGVSIDARKDSSVYRDIQMVFQDPYGSLNPRRTIFQLISEPWQVHRDIVPRSLWRTEAADLLDRVGLRSEHLDRYPHQFSGGQRQRISIARALAMKPKLVICDEAVSALDVSVQAQVLNLLQDLQTELGLTYLFIAHDLSVVRHVSTSVAVMYLGRIVEYGPRDEVFDRPAHPYTKALLSAIPDPHRQLNGDQQERIILRGEVPSPADPPSGCRFRTRCWKAQEVCETTEPPLISVLGSSDLVACHFPERATELIEGVEV